MPQTLTFMAIAKREGNKEGNQIHAFDQSNLRNKIGEVRVQSVQKMVHRTKRTPARCKGSMNSKYAGTYPSSYLHLGFLLPHVPLQGTTK